MILIRIGFALLISVVLSDAFSVITDYCLHSSRRKHVTNNIHGTRLSHKSKECSEDTPYRSIGELVGGLHGGKYHFESVDGGGSEYTLSGPTTNDGCDDTSREQEELPKWALRMKPNEGTSTLEVPSNSNRKNGMIRSASVTIVNDERTWEQFHAKIVCTHGDLFIVRPASGDLAPRGGASNACDESQPYSDSATINVIHNEKEQSIDVAQYWLVVGTEEEQWSYRLRLSCD